MINTTHQPPPPRPQDAFFEQHGVKLGFMSAFVKAAVDALKRVPAVNAVIEGDEIVYRDFYDVSIAVATPKGLVVPVLRDADKLNFAEVEKVCWGGRERGGGGMCLYEKERGGGGGRGRVIGAFGV